MHPRLYPCRGPGAGALVALDYLARENRSVAFNLGNGNGYSIREVFETVRQVTGREFRVEDGPRRSGDPAVLVADSQKVLMALGWRPQYSNLADIVRHAWNWELEKGELW